MVRSAPRAASCGKPVVMPTRRPIALQPGDLRRHPDHGPGGALDVLIDFTGSAGQKFILYTDAPAPFPMGDPRNDYFPGCTREPRPSPPGIGPNTRQIMKFRREAGTPGPVPNRATFL